MPTWGWILIAVLAVIAVVAIVVAVRATSSRRRSERLKEHFGPEYERAVVTSGDPRVAEDELAAREKKRKKLDIVALSPQAHANYAAQWRRVQTAFVDNPSGAVGEADRLVSQVMRERGYPVEDFEQQASDISVDHPEVVENYRAAHGIHLSQERSDVGTEKQREAFVHYRVLFEKLLETDKGKPEEARA
ncbi:hypothetical protein ABGB19_09695 [Mycobacterium sp. B14F4]|uniref:hypothetical protein n=1 Tax=Mycobacterium sp. B14F4 TaxID=3153565 RepID=UPI00325D8BFF